MTGTIQPDDRESISKLKESANHLSDQIEAGYETDLWLSKAQNTAKLARENDFWTRGGLIVVPDANDLRSKLISLHARCASWHTFAGHCMEEKRVPLIRQRYW